MAVAMTDLVSVPPVKAYWTLEMVAPLAAVAVASRVTLVPETLAPVAGMRMVVVGGAVLATVMEMALL